MTTQRYDVFRSQTEFSLTPEFQNMRREKHSVPLSQEMSTKVLSFLILCFTSAAFGEDFKTINGKEYKDATVTRVDPDGIAVKTKSGITKIYFTELPKEI